MYPHKREREREREKAISFYGQVYSETYELPIKGIVSIRRQTYTTRVKCCVMTLNYQRN